MEMKANYRLAVVMGVAGCGKSTIGEALADKMGGTYLEGDSFHPQANIEKMSNGDPLTDADRWPWLKIVAGEMKRSEGLVFVGCSALRKSYRNFITTAAGEPVLFIYLCGSKELISGRMSARQGHFMPTALLESQFATLEVPDATEHAISIDISQPKPSIVSNICKKLSVLAAANPHSPDDRAE